MKYDSWNDFFYFVLGASLASGRAFWVGENGGTNKNKAVDNTPLSISVSKDGKVARIRTGEQR